MLDSQGFTINAKTADTGSKGASTVANQVRTKGGRSTGSVGAQGAVTAVGMLHPQGRDDLGDKKIDRLRGVQKIGNKFWDTEMYFWIGGGIAGWLAKFTKNSKIIASVKAVCSGVPETFREVRLNNIFEFPSIFMKNVAKHSKLAGAHDWEAAANARAASLKDSANRMSGKMSSVTAPAMNSVKDGVRGAVDSFEKTAVGKPVAQGAQKIAGKMSERARYKFYNGLNEATNAMRHEKRDFLSKAMGMIQGTKPQVYSDHPAFDEVIKHMGNARGAKTAADRVMHTNLAKEAAAKAADIVKDGRGENVLKCLERAHLSAQSAHHLETAGARGLSGIVGGVMRAAGRVPLFSAVIGVGVAAGVTATVMTHRKENKLAKTLYSEIAAAAGANSSLLHMVDNEYHKGKGKHFFKTSMSLTSDVMNGIMAASPAATGAVYMVGAMAPSMLSGLVKDNVFLNAYAHLRQEETRGVKMPVEAKIVALRQMIGKLEAVETHGGFYNRLTEPLAEKIIDKKLSAQQTIRLLADENKFSALATEVLEEQKAQTAPAEKAPADKAPVINMADRPSNKLSNVAHEGRVVSMHKAAAI